MDSIRGPGTTWSNEDLKDVQGSILPLKGKDRKLEEETRAKMSRTLKSRTHQGRIQKRL